VIDEYLATAPPLYRDVYDLVAPHIPAGYSHDIQYGMPAWFVPLERYPDTYNKQPLQYVALAAQKSYVALYLSIYLNEAADAAFRTEYKASVGRLDMGKSCLRLRHEEDVDARLIAEAVAATSVDAFIAQYEHSRA
jgi:hypothetical protein